jgi:hypothetical protein
VISAVSARLRPNVPLTLGGRADLSSFIASIHIKIEVGVASVRQVLFYSPCVRQYCLSLSLSLSLLSVSRLRVRSQKTSLNEAMHDANDSKMTIANASRPRA